MKDQSRQKLTYAMRLLLCIYYLNECGKYVYTIDLSRIGLFYAF